MDTQQVVQQIPLDFLQANPLQPRGVITQDSLGELVESIKIHGVLEPLVVAHTPAGYQIIAGERRWRASKLAGLKTVPAIVKQTTPMGMLEMAIIENVQREDLNPIDRGNAFKKLEEEFQLTTSEIARRIGKSPSYISNSTKLLMLPDALKDGLLSGMITEGHARALASIQDPRSMIEAYRIVLAEKASVRRAEDLARRMKVKSGQPLASNPGHRPFIVSKQIDGWMHMLQQSFGDNSKVKLTRSTRSTRIVIELKGNPDKTQDQLNKILSLADANPQE